MVHRIENELLEVFYLFFGEKYRGSITEATTMDDITEWDSMSFISLISEIENKFNVKFSIDEAAQMYSYKKIVETLREKTSNG